MEGIQVGSQAGQPSSLANNNNITWMTDRIKSMTCFSATETLKNRMVFSSDQACETPTNFWKTLCHTGTLSFKGKDHNYYWYLWPRSTLLLSVTILSLIAR